MRKITLLAASISLFSIISLVGSLMLSNTRANIQSAQPFTGMQGAIDPELLAPNAAPTPIELKLFKTYRGRYGYVTAGIGVRNTGRGTISLTIPRGAGLVEAWLYWIILDDSTPNALNQYVDVNGIRTVGTKIGSGPDPCWGGVTQGITYRAEIKSKMRNTGISMGGGITFGVFIGGMSTYHTTTESPWKASQKAPMAEYVGLVLVYRASWLPAGGVLQIYDGYHYGTSLQSFTYVWPARASGGARFSSLTGDGQKNASPLTKNLDFAGTVIDKPVLNGYDPSITSRATYEGSLADTDTYNVGSLAPMAGGATAITWDTGSDCISWAALVFHTATDSPF